MENTCKTCINNDDGLCDRKGILVEDEDSCEHHWPVGKKVKIKKHEKKLDITPGSGRTGKGEGSEGNRKAPGRSGCPD